MKHILALIFSALFLTACASVNQPQLTPQEITARVCPPALAVLSVLAISPAISQDDRDNVAKVAPMINETCAMGTQTTSFDLNNISTVALPALAQIVTNSSLEEKEKQNTLLAIALAQIAISAVR